MDLKNVQHLEITRHPYESGKERNGGDYWFWYQYSRENRGDKFEVRYGTSSEFTFCRVKGSFEKLGCSDCPDYDGKECHAPPVLVSEEELAETLDNLDEQEEITDAALFSEVVV